MLTEWQSATQDLIAWQRIERENTEQFMLPFTYDFVAYPDVMVALSASVNEPARPGNVLDKAEAVYAESGFESDFAGLFASLRFEGMLNNRRVNLRLLIAKAETLEASTAAIIGRLSAYGE